MPFVYYVPTVPYDPAPLKCKFCDDKTDLWWKNFGGQQTWRGSPWRLVDARGKIHLCKKVEEVEFKE